MQRTVYKHGLVPGFKRGKGKANGETNAMAGRASKYCIDHAERVYRLCLLGLTDLEICSAFGINEQTLHNWQAQHPEFKQAILYGKQEADAKVTEALYKRAIGYQHPEVVLHVIDKEVTKTVVTRHYPPDTAACRIWLKNRTRNNEFVWQDSFQAEVTGRNGGKIQTESTVKIESLDLSSLTDEELQMCQAIGLKINKPKDEE